MGIYINYIRTNIICYNTNIQKTKQITYLLEKQNHKYEKEN